MKFCCKLQTLRKENKLSQEQLADMLDVSRQSVSKWESGNTYPEMDKLIQISKIFNCTLDDLTNDEVKTIISKEKERNNISNLVYSLLDLIKRSYDMLKKMKLKNIIFCVAEMFLVFLVLLMFHNVVDYIYYLGQNIFIYLGKASGIICNIWNFFLEILYIILSIIVFVYIYKIRYLDRYEKMEVVHEYSDESLEKDIKEEKKENINNEEKHEKVIIKHEKSFKLFDILGSVFMFFVKLMVLLFGLPFIVSLIILGMGIIISIILLFSGVTYFGLPLIILSSLVLNLTLLYMIYYFLFDKKIAVKKTLIIILSSLLLLGIGTGITTLEIANTNFTNNVSSLAQEKVITETFNMSNDLVIFEHFNTNYEIDNTLKDKVKIEISYFERFNNVRIDKSGNYINILNEEVESISSKYLYNMILTDLRTKNIHNYFNLDSVKVKVITSSENMKKLQDNLNKEYYNDNVNYYEDRINELQIELNESYDNNAILEEKINKLEEDILELEEKIDYYKDSLNNIIYNE